MLQPATNKARKEIKFWPIFIITVIVILLISAILISITPKKEAIIASDFVTDNYNGTQSTFKKVDYVGQQLTVPETFDIYQANSAINLSSDLTDEIILGYDLKQDKNLDNYWGNDPFLLIKNNYDGRYTFDMSYDPIKNDVAVIDQEAIDLCSNFFLKFGVNFPLIAQKDNITYLNSASESSVTEKAKAVREQIPFTYEINNYPMFYDNEDNYPFFCKVNNNYQIERIAFKEYIYKFEKVKTISSISIDQAVKNIKNGKASIINADSKIVDALDLSWINEAELTNVSVEYRFDEELKTTYPFYRFKANLTNSSGINIEAEIITPAVNTAVEKK